MRECDQWRKYDNKMSIKNSHKILKQLGLLLEHTGLCMMDLNKEALKISDIITPNSVDGLKILNYNSFNKICDSNEMHQYHIQFKVKDYGNENNHLRGVSKCEKVVVNWLDLIDETLSIQNFQNGDETRDSTMSMKNGAGIWYFAQNR